MSAAQHTPGPWGIQDDHGKRWIETTVGNDDTICEVVRRDRKVARDRDVEFNGNAQLIAAAPELLAALQALVDYDNYETEYDGRIFSICPDCGKQDGNHTERCEFVKARALIAKATGKEGGAA